MWLLSRVLRQYMATGTSGEPMTEDMEPVVNEEPVVTGTSGEPMTEDMEPVVNEEPVHGDWNQ